MTPHNTFLTGAIIIVVIAVVVDAGVTLLLFLLLLLLSDALVDVGKPCLGMAQAQSRGPGRRCHRY
jgi:hypothetical protein